MKELLQSETVLEREVRQRQPQNMLGISPPWYSFGGLDMDGGTREKPIPLAAGLGRVYTHTTYVLSRIA